MPGGRSGEVRSPAGEDIPPSACRQGRAAACAAAREPPRVWADLDCRRSGGILVTKGVSPPLGVPSTPSG